MALSEEKKTLQQGIVPMINHNVLCKVGLGLLLALYRVTKYAYNALYKAR